MAVPALLFPTEKQWDELKLACKERAGWQCEYVYANAQRCRNHEGQIIYRGWITVRGKRVRKRGTRHMHACHTGNDPANDSLVLECRCPRHRTEVDRKDEKARLVPERIPDHHY